MASIYHLVPAGYYESQPENQPYLPATFAEEKFIHCTAGVALLLEIANTYFDTLSEPLLVLEIIPKQVTAPIKFEKPIPPAGQAATDKSTDVNGQDILFPHIYGPLNRDAISTCFALHRDKAGHWQMPE